MPMTQRLTFPIPAGGNKGLEAVCYNRKEQSFLSLKEQSPLKFFSILRPSNEESYNSTQAQQLGFADLTVKNPNFLSITQRPDVRSFSGCVYNPTEDVYLILVKKEPQILAVTPSGEVVSKLKLPTEHQGGAEQYEGVTITPSGEIIVTSEPNHFIKLTH
jgi:uncharacterized protein YjiK